MKKVVYSIKKVRNPDEKLSGFGFINDEGTLLCKYVSKTGKRYTRAFDEVEQHCHPIIGKENEFKGYVTMYYPGLFLSVTKESLLRRMRHKNDLLQRNVEVRQSFQVLQMLECERQKKM